MVECAAECTARMSLSVLRAAASRSARWRRCSLSAAAAPSPARCQCRSSPLHDAADGGDTGMLCACASRRREIAGSGESTCMRAARERLHACIARGRCRHACMGSAPACGT